MMHYVDNYEVIPITIDGIPSATFSPNQTAFCGVKLEVKSRDEFATQRNGIGVVDCPDCLAKYRERMSKPFDCVRCKKILDAKDTMAFSPFDMERLCLSCR